MLSPVPEGSGIASDDHVMDVPSVLDQVMTRASAPVEDPRSKPLGRPIVGRVGTRYRHLREIARGGMGSIRLVHDRDLDRQVVMKMLTPELLEQPAFQELVVKEARSAGKLSHPNIVPVLDLGVNDAGELYFTMPYVIGDTLAEVIGQLSSGEPSAHAKFGFVQRLHIIQKICEAVSHAHSYAILHRDLKPSNVMIGPHGEVLVLDWGLALSLTMDQPETGRIVGTPGFMAPEQARGENDKLSAATDVYGIGGIMYALFALQPPYVDMGDTGEPLTLQRSSPPLAEVVRPEGQTPVPREISVIIERALDKDPARRFARVEDLSRAIDAYLEGQAPVVCIHTGFKRGLRWIGGFIDRWGSLAMFLVALVVVLPWVLVLVALFA